LLVCPLLAACGSGGDDEPTKTTAESKDCPMTAAAARAVQRRLTQSRQRSKVGAEIIVRELKKGLANTVTDESPDGRDAFILINDEPGVAGLRGTTASKRGSTRIELTARQGCGAVAYLPHMGPASATFTQNGQDAGGTGPAGG